MMGYRRLVRQQTSTLLGAVPKFTLRDGENHEASVGLGGVLDEIRREHLWYKCQERYGCTPLSCAAVK
jgi:hypothetical protein